MESLCSHTMVSTDTFVFLVIRNWMETLYQLKRMWEIGQSKVNFAIFSLENVTVNIGSPICMYDSNLCGPSKKPLVAFLSKRLLNLVGRLNLIVIHLTQTSLILIISIRLWATWNQSSRDAGIMRQRLVWRLYVSWTASSKSRTWNLTRMSF